VLGSRGTSAREGARPQATAGWDEQTGDWLDENAGKPFELVDHELGFTLARFVCVSELCYRKHTAPTRGRAPHGGITVAEGGFFLGVGFPNSS
jgi:hypothetical protein